MPDFERCAGCPAVAEGEKCDLLQQLLGKIDVNASNFRSVEVPCTIAENALMIKIYPVDNVIITKIGAFYGKFGKGFEDVTKAFFK